jgi:hypothetical protein
LANTPEMRVGTAAASAWPQRAAEQAVYESHDLAPTLAGSRVLLVLSGANALSKRVFLTHVHAFLGVPVTVHRVMAIEARPSFAAWMSWGGSRSRVDAEITGFSVSGLGYLNGLQIKNEGAGIFTRKPKRRHIRVTGRKAPTQSVRERI